MARYVELRDVDFDRVLMGRGFQKMKQAGCGEYIYVREEGTWQFKVYSSVWIGSGASRRVGEDAIRVMLIEGASGRVRAQTRINRVGESPVDVLRRVDARLRECEVMAKRLGKPTSVIADGRKTSDVGGDGGGAARALPRAGTGQTRVLKRQESTNRDGDWAKWLSYRYGGGESQS